MRRKLIVANWKMNGTIAEALAYAAILTHEVKAVGTLDVAIAVPFTALYSLGVAFSETDFQLAAQNLFWEESGAFTGEVAGAFLKDVGCRYVIVGHSERRQYFGETDATVQKRVAAAVTAGLTPILCIGENLAEREAKTTWGVLERQLTEGLCDIPIASLEDFAIAYEPVWAIGTGRTALPTEAQEVHALIRNWLSRNIDGATAERTRVIYGGSVKPDNSRSLLAQKNIDGLLVGGASLDVKQFIAIIRAAP